MVVNRVLAMGCLLCAFAGAQTFPPEFRTDDGTVRSRILYLADRMGSGNETTLSREFERLLAVPANRVYRQMDEQARAAALRTALPLVKQFVMSAAIREKQDENIARQFGAVNHGLKLPPASPAPSRRVQAMSEQLQKNPALVRDPKFMQEYAALQKTYVAHATEGVHDYLLTIFTESIGEAKRRAANDRESAGGDPKLAKCYDDAMALAAAEEQRFRLQLFRCSLMAQGREIPEGEADSFRKLRAQRLYDEKSMEGVVRRTLEEFLQTASTVDFTAQTVDKAGRRVFVRPEYEKKDGLWKMIYRNGSEPTAVAVQFAKAWLAELTPPAPAPAGAKSSATPAAKPSTAAKVAPAKAAPKK
ncbi:MAG: hypothetical protein ACPL7M_02695 [Bryobacteraceae bacterium]